MRQTLQGLKVLVVEDEPVLLMTLEDILSDLGCQIAEVAGTIKHAEMAADTADFEVALLDVTLGAHKIDGVAQRIAARKLPMVFASGLTANEIVARFGKDAIAIGKPYSLQAISSALKRATAPA